MTSCDSQFPSCTTIRRIVLGGRGREVLLDDLREAGVELNDMARQLFSLPDFDDSGHSRIVSTSEVAVRDLGLPRGGTISAMVEQAAAMGLARCPIELGPYLRIQYLDQPEGFVGHPHLVNQAPPGSVTIVSAWPKMDDDFPKGFYLRCIRGTLWLRGYKCDLRHVWNAEDRVVFLARPC